ncbi:zinc finger protein 668-like [Thrips palmi]|uniref:Zinc finger protein 668-like n=1 Tax=Thrips palmi TaxID=161013 RepID=A0A6P8ZAS6_THRPL|nr:zinc finger protein 668-like [Thrips palmi]
MLTKECCPQCDREADSSRLRLVQDSCGHKKCRECLLSDEAGCLLCSSSYPPEPEPEYIELRPAGGVVLSASVSTDPNSNSETDAKWDDAVQSAVIRTEVSSASAVPDNVPKLPLCSGSSSGKNVVDGESESAETPSEMPVVVNKNVEKRASPFGLKDHITFTPGDPPTYFCKKCEKSYNNRKAARYHNYCGASDKEKPHTCEECGQGFVTKAHLEYHEKSHTGLLPFTCKSCGKGFKQLSKLNRHLKSHEGPLEKPFRCDLCEKSFSSKQNLKDHILLHSKDHFVSCPVCNKKLSSQSCLRKHKKLHADPVHKCKDCGKKFPVKWTLEVHMKTHQRDRKFKCKICNRAFKIQSDLKRHALVHQEDGEWECKVCLLIFRRRDNLVRHLKNIHPESPLIISTKQSTDKDRDENMDEPERNDENSSGNSNGVSATNAVSVIRGPVIQRVESSSVSCNQLENRPGSAVDIQDKEWSVDLNFGNHPSGAISQYIQEKDWDLNFTLDNNPCGEIHPSSS